MKTYNKYISLDVRNNNPLNSQQWNEQTNERITKDKNTFVKYI